MTLLSDLKKDLLKTLFILWDESRGDYSDYLFDLIAELKGLSDESTRYFRFDMKLLETALNLEAEGSITLENIPRLRTILITIIRDKVLF